MVERSRTDDVDGSMHDSCLHMWGMGLDNPLEGIDVQRIIRPDVVAPDDRHVTRTAPTEYIGRLIGKDNASPPVC